MYVGAGSLLGRATDEAERRASLDALEKRIAAMADQVREEGLRKRGFQKDPENSFLKKGTLISFLSVNVAL